MERDIDSFVDGARERSDSLESEDLELLPPSVVSQEEEAGLEHGRSRKSEMRKEAIRRCQKRDSKLSSMVMVRADSTERMKSLREDSLVKCHSENLTSAAESPCALAPSSSFASTSSLSSSLSSSSSFSSNSSSPTPSPFSTSFTASSESPLEVVYDYFSRINFLFPHSLLAALTGSRNAFSCGRPFLKKFNIFFLSFPSDAGDVTEEDNAQMMSFIRSLDYRGLLFHFFQVLPLFLSLPSFPFTINPSSILFFLLSISISLLLSHSHSHSHPLPSGPHPERIRGGGGPSPPLLPHLRLLSPPLLLFSRQIYEEVAEYVVTHIPACQREPSAVHRLQRRANAAVH